MCIYRSYTLSTMRQYVNLLVY